MGFYPSEDTIQGKNLKNSIIQWEEIQSLENPTQLVADQIIEILNLNQVVVSLEYQILNDYIHFQFFGYRYSSIYYPALLASIKPSFQQIVLEMFDSAIINEYKSINKLN